MLSFIFHLIALLLLLHFVNDPLHLPTLRNDYILIWLVSRRPCVLNHAHNVHAIKNLAENDMLVVQKWCGGCCDEELAAIGVWTGVLC